MKKFFILLLVALISLSLFAGGKSDRSSKTSDAVTIEWWTWDPEMIETNKQIIADFEKANPGIKIDNTIIDSNEYWTALGIQAQQNKLPDVFMMSSGYLEEWVADGLLMNLDSLIENDKGFFDNFYKAAFDVTKDIAAADHYYEVPFALVNTVLFYNKDMFDAAGIPYPTDDWTWDDFTDAAKKLTIDKDGDGTPDQWGFWFYGRYAHAESFIFANGGSLVNKETMRFDPDDKALEALEMLLDMVLVDKSAPPQKDMSALKNQQVFPNGLCAMWVDGAWYADDFVKVDGLNWDFVRVPQGPSGERITYGWPDGYAIAPNTKHPEEAWKFIKYISGEGIGLDQFMIGKIPTYKALTESKEFLNLAPNANMALLVEMASDEMTTSYTQGWSEWRGYGASDSMGLNGVIDGITNGEIGLDEALEKAKTSIDKILSRYYK